MDVGFNFLYGEFAWCLHRVYTSSFMQTRVTALALSLLFFFNFRLRLLIFWLGPAAVLMPPLKTTKGVCPKKGTPCQCCKPQGYLEPFLARFTRQEEIAPQNEKNASARKPPRQPEGRTIRRSWVDQCV